VQNVVYCLFVPLDRKTTRKKSEPTTNDKTNANGQFVNTTSTNIFFVNKNTVDGSFLFWFRIFTHNCLIICLALSLSLIFFCLSLCTKI